MIFKSASILRLAATSVSALRTVCARIIFINSTCMSVLNNQIIHIINNRHTYRHIGIYCKHHLFFGSDKSRMRALDFLILNLISISAQRIDQGTSHLFSQCHFRPPYLFYARIYTTKHQRATYNSARIYHNEEQRPIYTNEHVRPHLPQRARTSA